MHLSRQRRAPGLTRKMPGIKLRHGEASITRRGLTVRYTLNYQRVRFEERVKTMSSEQQGAGFLTSEW